MKSFSQCHNLENSKQADCKCEVCAAINVDWTSLSKSEKMVKALLLKAQYAAELNETLD